MKTLNSLVLLASLSLASTALGQSDANSDQDRLSKARGTKVGLGAAISSGSVVLVANSGFSSSGLTAALRVPVNYSMFKLEPEIGIYSTSDKTESSGQTSESSLTTARAGIGLYYNATVSSDASVYAGPKFGVALIKSSSEQSAIIDDVRDALIVTQDTKRTDLFASAIVGGEYFFSSRFSVGAELGVEYLSKGNETRTNSSNPAPQQFETSGSEIQTRSALTARFYF